MWVCKRLDMPWSLLGYGLLRCLGRVDPTRSADRLEAHWSPDGDGLAVLSVRSGLDLVLACSQLPPGSEVLLSAITIKDMPDIVARHGLVPVPVDLHAHTMAPALDSLREAITPATRAIVVAHLFGGRIDLTPLIRLAREYGLLVIEDCAQAFAGDGFTGHSEADVSLFSFGPIKTATALGGGLARVRDPQLLVRMRQRHQRYPIQSQRAYFSRLLSYALLKCLTSRPLYGPVLALRKRLGHVDDRGTKNDALKNFSAGDLIPQIRRRPCGALLSVLSRSIVGFDNQKLARRTAHGERMKGLLGDRVRCPGIASAPHNYWVFPIATADPKQTIARLRSAGFDAAQGDSMRAVPPPDDRPELTPRRATKVALQLVYVPCYAELPEDELVRLSGLLIDDAGIAPAAGSDWPEPAAVCRPYERPRTQVAVNGTAVQSDARLTKI